jgi:hypothetical protein
MLESVSAIRAEDQWAAPAGCLHTRLHLMLWILFEGRLEDKTGLLLVQREDSVIGSMN